MRRSRQAATVALFLMAVAALTMSLLDGRTSVRLVLAIAGVACLLACRVTSRSQP